MKKLCLSLILLGLLLCNNFSLTARADSYKGFDENVVRAYKTLKIKTIKPHLLLAENATTEAVDVEVQNFLIKNNYFEKNLKNKPGIFLIKTKPVQIKNKSGEISKYLEVKDVYNIKNPEKFMYALNNNISKKDLSDRASIATKINGDSTLYAIVAEKIDKKDAPAALKVVRGGYNGFLSLFMYMPKLGFGCIINPPLEWLKTDTASDIYRGISSEVEKISTGEESQLNAKYFQKN